MITLTLVVKKNNLFNWLAGMSVKLGALACLFIQRVDVSICDNVYLVVWLETFLRVVIF